MYNYRLKTARKINRDILNVSLSPVTDADMFAFDAGQYVALGFKKDGRPSLSRCFSIISSTRNPDLEFAIKLKGNFTQTLEELKPDQPFFVYGPFGQFVFNKSSRNTPVFIAGGIGITPCLSIIEDLLRSGHKRSIALLYSNRNSDEIPFAERLISLSEEYKNFKVVFFVSGENRYNLKHKYVVSGRIDTERIDRITGEHASNFDYYVCGPTEFNRTMVNQVKSLGVEDEQITVEDFGLAKPLKLRSGSGAKLSKRTYQLSGALIMAVLGIIAVFDLYRSMPVIVYSLNHPNSVTTTAKPSSPYSLALYNGSFKNRYVSFGSGTGPGITNTYKSPITSVS